MRLNVTKLFLLTAFVISWPAHAFGPDDYMPDVSVEAPLSESQLFDVFSGKTHRGTYTFLSRDITTFAFQETTRADGRVIHVQQARTDTGQWTISGDIICYDYDDPRLLQACFNIYARGNCYYHYQVSAQGQSKFGFTARSVIAGETPSCEPSLV